MICTSGKKRCKNDGEYPPPHVLESAAFESYYRECGVIPAAEFGDFIASLRKPLGTSFRITGHPSDPGAIVLRQKLEGHFNTRLGELLVGDEKLDPPRSICWFPGRMAWRLDVPRSILRGKGVVKGQETCTHQRLAEFHAWLINETDLGTISRQEEVSMVPPLLLDVRPGHVVLDMCAAPGSKTQQLIEALSPPTCSGNAADDTAGLVVANDMDYKRCHLLVHQAKLPRPHPDPNVLP